MSNHPIYRIAAQLARRPSHVPHPRDFLHIGLLPFAYQLHVAPLETSFAGIS